MTKYLIACLLALATGAGLFAHAAQPEQQWYLVTDHGLSCPMDSVCYLVAADDDELFSVVIVDGVFSFVQRVHFEQREVAGISQPRAEAEALRPMMVRDVLHLSGYQPGQEAVLLSLDGKVVARQPLAAQGTDVDVSALPKGSYVLRIGRSAVPFVKQ